MTLHEDLVEVSREYLGFAAERFVRIVLQHIGLAPVDITESDLGRFAAEISAAAGKSLTEAQKEEFRRDVLNLAGQVRT